MNTVNWEETPNPHTLKFTFDSPICEFEGEYASAMETENAPLAMQLFAFPWTSKIYITTHSVSITKHDWIDWDILKEPLLEILTDFTKEGQPAIETPPTKDTAPLLDSTEAQRIFTIIEEEIRPAVAQDGGDILFQKFENEVVYVKLRGACSGCPSSTATLKEGVIKRLQNEFPHIQDIVPV